MLRESQYILRQINIVLDLVLCVVAFFVAHAIRHVLSIYVAPGLLEPSTMAYYRWLLPVAPLVLVPALAYNGVYRSLQIRTPMRILARRVAVACAK